MNADGVMNSVLLTSVNSESLTCYMEKVAVICRLGTIMELIVAELGSLHQESEGSHFLA